MQRSVKRYISKVCCSCWLIPVAALTLLLAAGEAVQAYPGEYGEHHRHHEHINPREIDGKIKVVNDTEFDMYVTCDGRNLGPVTRRSSEEFWVKCGSQYILADIEGYKCGKDVDIDPRRRHEEVTFSPSDFMRLPEQR
ncbi:MAG: hypothetical protein Q4F00_08620 [bacterium]|nr:hypothetical protein [bacterium]